MNGEFNNNGMDDDDVGGDRCRSLRDQSNGEVDALLLIPPLNPFRR
jgi:hypothetical protein